MLARSLIEGSTWIKKRSDEIVEDLIKEKDKSLTSGDSVTVALYVRYLKRTGAHLMNIVSGVANPFERIGYSPEGDDDT